MKYLKKYFSIYYSFYFYNGEAISRRRFKSLGQFERIDALSQSTDRNLFCVAVNIILSIFFMILGSFI